MKLVHMDFKNKIIFNEDEINVIVIENALFYREVIKDIYQQINDNIKGKLVLSEDIEMLSMNKVAYYINDIFNMKLNDRKIINKLYARLKENIHNEDHFVETNKIWEEIEKYMINVLSDIDIPLEYDLDENINNIFKLLNVRIAEEYETIYEKLLDYITVLMDMLEIKVFFLINLKSYFTKEELQLLYKEIVIRKINVVIIEPFENKEKLMYEKVYIIDKDTCEIYQ